jgi:hypothetical protein
LRGTHRPAADLATESSWRQSEIGLHHTHKVRIRHHLAGAWVAIEQRDIDGAGCVTAFELGLRSDIHVGAALLLELMCF